MIISLIISRQTEVGSQPLLLATWIREESTNQYGYHLKKTYSVVPQIGYKSMAYLDVTARNDWSSTFKGTNTGSFFYPSIGLSGIITDIFRCSTDIMPYMKVRISYSESR